MQSIGPGGSTWSGITKIGFGGELTRVPVYGTLLNDSQLPPTGSDRRRVRADLADRLAIAFADLDDARRPSDLDLPGYRLHPLKGDLKPFRSISVSGNWRIVFRFDEGDVYDVDLVDYH